MYGKIINTYNSTNIFWFNSFNWISDINLLRKHDEGYDYDKIIKMMNEQTGQNLDVLSKVNREKDRIEEKIRKRKKELGMSLIYNQK